MENNSLCPDNSISLATSSFVSRSSLPAERGAAFSRLVHYTSVPVPL
jgi:hypothetical protein